MSTTKHPGRLQTLFLSCIVLIPVCGFLSWGIRELLFPPTDVCAIERNEGKNLLDISRVYPIGNNIKSIGHVGGEAESVFVRGDIAFLKLGFELAAFDIQNPANPRRVGYLLIPGELIYVDETGHYAYIHSFGESRGLWKVDVSNPAQMSASHIYNTKFAITGVRLLNEKAFVTTRTCEFTYFFEGSIKTRCDNTLHIIDTNDPDAPIQCYQGLMGNVRRLAISSAPELITAPKTAIQGNYRYEAKGKDGLRVYDASDPHQLTEVGSYSSSAEFIDVFVYKAHALTTSVECKNPEIHYCLHAFDVANPADPKDVGELPHKPVIVTEFDHYVILRKQFEHDWSLGLEILDRSSPRSDDALPVPPEIEAIVDMVVRDKRGYGLTRDNRFLIVDLSNIENPEIIASHTLSSPYHPGYEVSVMGRYAYVIVADVGMKVLDISDEANILEVATYQMKSTPVAITARDHYAYIAEWYGTLEIVDISDPARPTQVQVYDAGDRINDMHIVKNYLLMTAGNSGLQVIDRSNPAAPHLIGSLITDTFVTGLDVDCPYIYISDIENGLFVLRSNLISAEDCQ